MTRSFRFIPDHRGIDAVSSGPGIAPILNDRADEAARRMRSLAANFHRGSFFDFRDSIRAEHARPVGKPVAWVGSDSPGWHLQEYGTLYQPARAVIRRALRQTPGVEFDEGR